MTLCDSCCKAKAHVWPFHSSFSSTSPCTLWCLGSRPDSSNGNRYYVHFTDGCSRFSWREITILQTDGGSSFKPLARLYPEIVHQTSCPYTPQQNGLAERRHRELGLAVMAHASIPERALLGWCFSKHRFSHQSSSPFQGAFSFSLSQCSYSFWCVRIMLLTLPHPIMISHRWRGERTSWLSSDTQTCTCRLVLQWVTTIITWFATQCILETLQLERDIASACAHKKTFLVASLLPFGFFNMGVCFFLWIFILVRLLHITLLLITTITLPSEPHTDYRSQGLGRCWMNRSPPSSPCSTCHGVLPRVKKTCIERVIF